jgi:hypothetical protein
VLNIGTSILGALFGRKKVSTSVTSAIKGVSRVGNEHGDVRRAAEDVASLLQQEQQLEKEFQDEAARVQAQFDAGALAIEQKDLAPKKADTKVEEVVLLWTPWASGKSGESPLAS